MGREIRMVPPNWKHPKGQHDEFQPMFNENFDDAFATWLAHFDRIRNGDLDEIERDCYAGEGKNPLAEWLADSPPPDRNYYRPWRDDEATWVQVWETVSEGTPVSPPFPTKEKLIAYLVKHGDFWDQKRGHGVYSIEQATAFVESGYAPSMVISGGQMARGIAAASLPAAK